MVDFQPPKQVKDNDDIRAVVLALALCNLVLADENASKELKESAEAVQPKLQSLMLRLSK